MRLKVLAVVLICCATVSAPSVAQESDSSYATGVVYEDVNRNAVRDSSEPGVQGVRVSNGRISVKTGPTGSYRLPVGDDTIVFVIKPRNYKTTIDANNVPRFYYIHKPNGSPKLKHAGVDPTGPLPTSVDFPLYRSQEPDCFRAVFLGDTQVTSTQQIAFLAHDVIEELVGNDSAFAVSLGDIVGDRLELYEPLIPVMGKTGMPCYYVKGNHDSNYDGAPTQKLINETYERFFGPSHYSYDYGPVHFIVLDNPYFGGGKGYVGRLDLEQMAFLRDDLASIPKQQLVVLMMHIPIVEMTDRARIYDLLRDHPNTFSISGHTHTQHNCFVTQKDGWKGTTPHHHLINATACGSWWNGALDELGIPHTTMRDGTPNGYSVITFENTSYSVRFKVARRPQDYQMNIYAPDELEAAKTDKAEVLVNVFAGSERSKVEMCIEGKTPWTAMQLAPTPDPAYASTKAREDALKPRPGGELPGPGKSPHIWKANLPTGLPPGTHLIKVRTLDMFGQTFTGSRVLAIR